jgi:hypothetical protein
MLALCITGFDVDPTIVTRTIGFEPTSVGRIGEPSPSGRPRRFNGWWHEAESQRLAGGEQHDDALVRILENLNGREDRFAELRETIRPKQISIYGGLYVPSDAQCGVWLEPDQMMLLAACGVGWGLIFSLPIRSLFRMSDPKPEDPLPTGSRHPSVDDRGSKLVVRDDEQASEVGELEE